MKKIIKYIGIFLLLALVVMQFIRLDKNEEGYESLEAFKKDTKPSKEVLAILKKHCFDCHTNQTNYFWYAEIAPVSYWIANHVNHGKGDFNMATWNEYSVKKRDHKLEELLEELEEGEMPLNSYTWIHGNLPEKDRELLLQWATLVRLQYKDELKVSSN